MWFGKKREELKCPLCNQAKIPQINLERYESDWRFSPFHLGCMVNKIKELENKLHLLEDKNI